MESEKLLDKPKKQEISYFQSKFFKKRSKRRSRYRGQSDKKGLQSLERLLGQDLVSKAADFLAHERSILEVTRMMSFEMNLLVFQKLRNVAMKKEYKKRRSKSRQKLLPKKCLALSNGLISKQQMMAKLLISTSWSTKKVNFYRWSLVCRDGGSGGRGRGTPTQILADRIEGAAGKRWHAALLLADSYFQILRHP